MNEEILVRSDATLTDVDVKQRIIEVIAVPWEQRAEVQWRGEKWGELFVAGAFDGTENSAGRIRVNREHNRGDTVGKVISLDPRHVDGLLTRVKVAKTLRGDETLALADEDMISGSIGYFVKAPSDVEINQKTKLRRVKRGFLDHLALVESPAYEGARVLAVHEKQQQPPVETPLGATPNLDEILQDEVLAWARSRAKKV